MYSVTTPGSRATGVVVGLLAVAAAVGVLAGGPSVSLWCVAIAALTVLLSGRLGWFLSLALVSGGFLVAEYALLRLASATGVGIPLADIVAWTVVSVAIAVRLTVRPVPLGLRGTRAWMVAAACSGAVVIVAGTALAQVVPGALRLAWAMNSDIVNGMVFARRMLADGGIDPVSTSQPTAVPFAMIAANMAPGRSALADAAILEHDVLRAVQVWVLVIALACLLAGAIVARAARGMRRPLAALLVALASCAGIVWYVIGVQFQFGFINSAFAIAVLLAAWLAYLEAERMPLRALGALFVVATAVLAVWSPLVVCVAGLGGIVLVRRWRELRGARPAHLALAGLGVVAFLAYGALVTLPGFLAESVYLSADGGFPAIGPASVMVIASITALLACIVASRHPGDHGAVGALVFVGAFVIGLAYLLLQRTDSTPWGYYPAKFAWTASIVLVVISVSLAAELLARYTPRSRWHAATVATGVLLLASLLWAPSGSPRPSSQLPLIGVFSGDLFGLSNAQSDAVFALSGRANGQDVLWHSAMGDFWPNFWLLQIDVDDPDNNPVRGFAHDTVPLTATQVCTIVDMLGADVVIHTSDAARRAELAVACPDGDYRLVVDDY
jgi:hypothetical protein